MSEFAPGFCPELGRKCVDARAEIERLQELLRGFGANRYWEGRWRDAEAEVERLRAALANLIADIEEYERVNNLAPNPGKQDCWQSVTRAKAVLGGQVRT